MSPESGNDTLCIHDNKQPCQSLTPILQYDGFARFGTGAVSLYLEHGNYDITGSVVFPERFPRNVILQLDERGVTVTCRSTSYHGCIQIGMDTNGGSRRRRLYIVGGPLSFRSPTASSSLDFMSITSSYFEFPLPTFCSPRVGTLFQSTQCMQLNDVGAQRTMIHLKQDDSPYFIVEDESRFQNAITFESTGSLTLRRAQAKRVVGVYFLSATPPNFLSTYADSSLLLLEDILIEDSIGTSVRIRAKRAHFSRFVSRGNRGRSIEVLDIGAEMNISHSCFENLSLGGLSAVDISLTRLANNIEDTVFQNCIGASVLKVKSAEVRLVNVLFDHNSPSLSTTKTVVDVNSQSVINIYTSNFTNNGHKYSLGGAIKLDAVTEALVSGCVFEGNTADRGGAIYSVSSQVEISGSTLSNNSAALGGALFGTFAGQYILFRSTISRNNATQGGGIWVENQNLRLDESTLEYNTAQEDGGAVYFNQQEFVSEDSEEISPLLFRSSSAFMNEAVTGHGGAIFYGSCGIGTKFEGTLSHNSATGGGGGAVFWNPLASCEIAEPNLDSATVVGNRAQYGPDIATYHHHIRMMLEEDDSKVEQDSGSNFRFLFLVRVLDYYENPILIQETSPVFIGLYIDQEVGIGGSEVSIIGTSVRQMNYGISNFTEAVGLLGVPGESYRILADISGTSSTVLSNFDSLNVTLRRCKDGELRVNNACILCPSGKFSNETISNEEDAEDGCYACASGSIAPVRGSPTCTPCGQDLEPNTDRTSCVRCPLGFDALPGKVCSECAPGRFADGTTAGCVDCPVGRFTSLTTKRDGCIPCPLGQYAPYNASTSCLSCDFNTFANSTGLSSCYECQVEKWEFATTRGMSACGQCSYNEYPRYRNLTSAASFDKCEDCPPNAVCDTDVFTVTPVSGYWVSRHPHGLVSSYSCPRGYCGTSSSCGTNRPPPDSNPLCGHCLDGYYEWNGICEECGPLGTATFVISILLSIPLVYVFHKISQSGGGSLGIAMYFVQISLLLLEGSGSAAGEHDRSSFGWLEVFNLDNFALKAGCLAKFSPMEHLIWDIFRPLLLYVNLALLSLGTFLYLRIRGRDSEFSFVPYQRTLISLYFFSYNRTVNTVFQSLHCVEIEFEGSAQSLIWTRPAIECDGSSYTNLVVGVSFYMFLEVAVVPMYLLFQLVYSRNRLYQKGSGASHVFGALTQMFKPSCFYWFLWSVSRHTILVGLSVFMAQRRATRLSYMAAVNSFVLLVQLLMKPFQSSTDNSAESICLFLLVLLSNLLFDGISVATIVMIVVIPAICVCLYGVQDKIKKGVNFLQRKFGGHGGKKESVTCSGRKSDSENSGRDNNAMSDFESQVERHVSMDNPQLNESPRNSISTQALEMTPTTHHTPLHLTNNEIFSSSQVFSTIPSTPSTLIERHSAAKNGPQHANQEQVDDTVGSNEDGILLGGGWTQFLDDKGFPYYYNSDTGQTTWEKPTLE